MLPVPRGVVAWLMGGRRGPRAAARAPLLVNVACSPDRLVLWIDQAGDRRAVDCLRGRPWLMALLPLLAPLLRLQIRRGRLIWRPHPAGVLFALDAFIGRWRQTVAWRRQVRGGVRLADIHPPLRGSR